MEKETRHVRERKFSNTSVASAARRCGKRDFRTAARIATCTALITLSAPAFSKPVAFAGVKRSTTAATLHENSCQGTAATGGSQRLEKASANLGGGAGVTDGLVRSRQEATGQPYRDGMGAVAAETAVGSSIAPSMLSRALYCGAEVTKGFVNAGLQTMDQQAPMGMGATAPNQPASAAADQMAEEIPHPFFTHMGMPEAVGTYSLRTAGLITKGLDGRTEGDFAFHFETGLTKSIGFHVRNDRFLANPSTEVMFQFAAIKSGMNGIAALVEFEIPTNKSSNRVNTLVGFSSSLSGNRYAINQVLHYNPRAGMVDASVALVYQATKNLYLVAEVLGTRMKGGAIIINPLAGVKFKVRNSLVIGLGYIKSVTKNRDFSSQYIFQPDFSW